MADIPQIFFGPNWWRWTEVSSRDIPSVLLAARYCLHVTCALQMLRLVPQVTLIGVTEAGYTHKDNWAVFVPISPLPDQRQAPDYFMSSQINL